MSDVFASPIFWIWVWILLLTSNAKTLVFLYLIKKRIVSVNQLKLESAHQTLVVFIYVSVLLTAWNLLCVWMWSQEFRHHSQCSLDTGICAWVCVTPKCFFFPSETKDGGNSIHQQKKTPPANQVMERFREATSPHQNPTPFPSWKAFKPLCWDPNCQGPLSCHLCLAVLVGRTKDPWHL